MGKDRNIITLAGSDAHISGIGRATIILPIGVRLIIEDALLYSESKHTILSFKYISENGFHVEFNKVDDIEYLFMTKCDGYERKVVEK